MSDEVPLILAGLLEDKGNSDSKNSQQINSRIENVLNQTAIELSMVRQEQQLNQDRLVLLGQQLRKEMLEMQNDLVIRFSESQSPVQEQPDDQSHIRHSLQIVRIPSRDTSRNISPIMQMSDSDLQTKFTNVDKKLKQIEWKVDRQNDQYWLQQIIKSLTKDKVFKERLVQLDQSFVHEVVDQKFSEHKLNFDQRLSNTTGFLHNIASALRRMDDTIQENKQTVQMVRDALIESQKGLHQKIEKIQVEKTQFEQKLNGQMTDFDLRFEELQKQLVFKNPSLDSIDYRQRGDIDALKRTINTLKESHHIETAKLHDQIQKILENTRQINEETDRRLMKILNESEKKNEQNSRFRKKSTPFQMQSDKAYYIQSLREEFLVQEKKQTPRQHTGEDPEVISQMQKIIEDFGQVLKDFKKIFDPRQIESRDKSRTSTKRREFTESCEFDDRRIFSPDKTFFMVGQMIDIRKRGISMRKHKLESYQSDVSQLSALMQLYNTPRNILTEETKNPAKFEMQKIMNNHRLRTSHQEKSQMFS